VHPNIPSPEERWPRIVLRRVGLMLATLIVPEAIIAWAWRQRQLAIELAESHKGEGWTITHGFFATMGGFMEYEGNKPIRVLLPDQLESYSLTGNGDFPRLSKAEIDDKSKGDFIAKGLVVLQTAWFVMQCIARSVQGLPITELELITVAFATLNVVIYILWWDKPLNVQRGVRVYKKRNTEEPVDDGDVEATVGFWGAIRDALSDLPAAIVRGPLVDTSDEMPWLARIIFWPVFRPFMIISGGDFDERYEDLKRVNTFYPGQWVRSSSSGVLLVIVIASAFGGIHCFGWSFTFPSTTERTLWRVASVSISCLPLVMMLVGTTIAMTIEIPDALWAIIIVPFLSLYVFSRLVLLVLPFLCLRSLPPAAYHVVRWTSLIPHI